MPAAIDVTNLDFVLLAAHDANVVDGAATVLRGAGVTAESHELGLRINCRGTNWRAALGRLATSLSTPARRALRVALVPISADALAFQKALLMSRSLDATCITLEIAPAGAPAVPATAPTAADTHAFGDVFKGQSLE